MGGDTAMEARAVAACRAVQETPLRGLHEAVEQLARELEGGTGTGLFGEFFRLV